MSDNDSERDPRNASNISGYQSQANQSKQSRSGQPRARSRDQENRDQNDGRRLTKQKKDAPKQGKEAEGQVDDFQKFRGILICLILLALFADMIFLAYLMFWNIVPLTDDIQIHYVSSILYFIFSILTLLVLALTYDRVNVAVNPSQIVALPFVLGCYFVILLAISIVIMVDDYAAAAARIYPGLSLNQKIFFKEDQQVLEDYRGHYTLWAGIFQIIQSVLVLFIMGMVCAMSKKLEALSGVKFKGKEGHSRAVVIEEHQAARFDNIQVNYEDKLMMQLQLGRFKPRFKKGQGQHEDDLESKDGYVYDSDNEDMDYEIKFDNQQY